MTNPTDLRYAPTHEWVKLEGSIATIGVSKFAVEQLTEPTFLELAKRGKSVRESEEIGVIESVKSTSSIYSPLSGEVVEVNQAALDNLALVNDDPFGAGWLLKLKVNPDVSLDHLLDATQYDAQIAGH